MKTTLLSLAVLSALTAVLWFGLPGFATRRDSSASASKSFTSKTVSEPVAVIVVPERADLAIVQAETDLAPTVVETGAPKAVPARAPRFTRILDAHAALPARLADLDKLGAESLDSAALTELSVYLLTAPPADEFAATRERALRNSLMNYLRGRPEAAEVFVPVLAKQVFDPSQDPALRDYAVQHLAAWVPKLSPVLALEAEGILHKALAEPAHTLAGTALLGLRDLSGQGHLTSAFDAKGESLRIASDPAMSLPSRITALALGAQLGEPDARLLSLAESWVSDPAQPLGARLSAQALLTAATSSSF